MLLLFVFVAALLFSAQEDFAVPPWQRGETPSIHGVTLGTLLSAAREELGKPRADRGVPSSDDDMFGMGKLRKLTYDGLTLDLCKPKGDPEFHVWRITVTGKQWVLSPGVRMGMDRGAFVKVLGEPESVSDVEGTGIKRLHYTFRSFDGWLWADMSSDKLVEIGLAEDWS